MRNPGDWLLPVCALAVTLLLSGCNGSDTPSRPAPTTHIVVGGSMAPTLLGQRIMVSCAECGLDWPVDASDAPLSRVICFHCGKSAIWAEDADMEVGQLVQVEAVEGRGLIRGELVAINLELKMHVKRIAAIPGDVVEVDGLHLVVSGRRLEDLLGDQQPAIELPTFLVDEDTGRSTSRWSSDSNSWKRNRDRQWTVSRDDAAPWLIYSHHSVYDNDQPSPIWDDYPYNSGLSRRLHPVDRLVIRGAGRPALDIDVALWTKQGAVMATTNIDRGVFTAATNDGLPLAGLPVDAHHPVAIRVPNGEQFELALITIERGIEYRLTRHHVQSRYPIQLGDDEYFVVGDNIPISVDSRDFGVVTAEQIEGRIVR